MTDLQHLFSRDLLYLSQVPPDICVVVVEQVVRDLKQPCVYCVNCWVDRLRVLAQLTLLLLLAPLLLSV